ncbi:STY0301 family protein [Massilia sp. DWR3-1-1]|uniref:STY0301 family protein n=1 Tax=Massilia sp. DWR3-1-1 TaxID=2804559 RepID=UPI003CEC243A
MKALLASLLLCAGAQAKEFHCPSQYPSETHALVGDTHTFVSPSRLVRAGVYWGELGGQGEMHGDRKTSKDAVLVRFGLPEKEKKWFVCEYGNSSITMWTAIEDRATECLLQQSSRGGVVTVRAQCK